MKWNIVTDSSCDLPSAVRMGGTLKIASVPFSIQVGGHSFVDNEQLDRPALFAALEQERGLYSVSCPTPLQWAAEFQQADYTIALTASSKLSPSRDSALTARELVLAGSPCKRIAVLDSYAAGPALALCVEELETLIRRGMAFEDVVFGAREILKKTQSTFALASFQGLAKTGLPGRLPKFLARPLDMRGVGCLERGKVLVEWVTRGSRRAVESLVGEMKERGFPGSKAAIAHCDAPALAEVLQERILKEWRNAEVQILSCRGLCSCYAQRGGVLLAFETWKAQLVQRRDKRPLFHWAGTQEEKAGAATW